MIKQSGTFDNQIQETYVLKHLWRTILVPHSFLFFTPKQTYSSLKPLGSWSRDLSARVDLFAKWAHTAHAPKTYWIGAFTFPTGFLTAVLQTSARQNNVSVDSLSWEFTVQNTNDSNLLPTPKDGVYVCNLYLQGAGWDKKSTCLIEATPMQLVCPMPIVHFRPMENKKKSMKSKLLKHFVSRLLQHFVKTGGGFLPKLVICFMRLSDYGSGQSGN